MPQDADDGIPPCRSGGGAVSARDRAWCRDRASLDTLPIGKAEVRRKGARVALLAFGAVVPAAEKVGEELGLTVVNMRFVKPLDRALLLELAKSHEGS
jgi:deoxyxylulose-5-phosphate synthase